MKSLLVAVAFFCLVSVALCGSHGISIGIPLPFIKLRFVDIAQLFGGHHGGHGGGHHGFGLELGGHGGHGGYHGY